MNGALALPLIDDQGLFSIRITNTVRTGGMLAAVDAKAPSTVNARILKRVFRTMMTFS